MCKANYVSHVKGKMSGEPPSRPRFLRSYLITNGVIMRANSEMAYKKNLTMRSIMYIIIFTDEDAPPPANQTIISAQAGHAESAPQSGAARQLSRQRVLRPGRLAAGQVRDAAAGGCRKATGQSGSRDVWLFASLVLSGAGSLSRSWPCRAVATETRAPVREQAYARTDAVCGTTSARRAEDLQSSDSGTNRTALRDLGAPAQYRSSAAASKKTPVSPESAAIAFADRRLVAAYEELRSQAVQGWQQGPGVTVMMTRGFRGWMEVCSQLFANQGSCPQVPDRPTPSMPSGLRGELVILLASMLLRRASKGVA